MKAACAILILTAFFQPSAAPAASPQEGAHHEHGMHHWSAPAEAAARSNPVPADEESVQRGQVLFRTHCTGCHGQDGSGGGPAAAGLRPAPPNLRRMVNFHSDGDLAWKIANGRGSMPAWQGILQEKQIWDVVNYLRRQGR